MERPRLEIARRFRRIVAMGRPFVALLLVAAATLAVNSESLAGTVREALKTDWAYFVLDEPISDCFTDDGSARADRMATIQATSNYCDPQLQNWSSEWPNAEGMTSYNDRCHPMPSLGWSYIHEESRQFAYTYRPTCSNSTVSTAHDYVRRHFKYYCPDGYTIFRPTLPGGGQSGIPACRLNTGSTTPDPEKNLGLQCPVEGNPINVATGNKIAQEVDYRGTGAFPLVFERFYNSQGEGWTHSYGQSVELHLISGTLLTARVRRPNGRVIIFERQGNAWVPDADIVYQLTSTSDASGAITFWQLRTDEDVLETYDGAGRLLSVANRAGVTHAIAYDPNGRLASVAHPTGPMLTFVTDMQGRVVQMTAPGGELYEYGYDLVGNLSEVTLPDQRERQFLYNESAHTGGASLPTALTGILDESSSRFATYAYDARGRAVSSEHGSGVDRVEVSYNVDGTATVEDALNGQRTYAFVTQFGVAKTGSLTGGACASCGNAASYTYLSSGDWNVTRDRRGVETRYFWNAARHLMTQKTENNTASSSQRRNSYYTWHPTFRLPMAVTVGSRTESYTHDSAGNVLTAATLDTTTNESRTFTYTYNVFGQVLTADGPRTDVADVTTFTYYTCITGFECGQLNTITDALGHTTIYNTYNAHGQPLTITDPNGVVTTLTYDLRQRVLSRTVGGEQTTFVYWPTGLLKKSTLPDGSFLEYTYDAAHHLTAINDAEGNRILYTLDAMGNRIKEESFDPSSALAKTRSRVFNSLNQLWKEIGAADTASVTTEFTYDNNGNQTGIAAPLGRSTGQTYDAFNRLAQITDAATGLTKYGYNALDQLISVTDPRNKSTTYSYNALGDLKQQVSPDTGTSVHTYDSGGNLATRTDARNKTGTYSYDALNRVTQLSYPDQTITYAYDQNTNGKGRLTSLSDGSGTTSFGYDALGRVTSRQQTIGGVSKALGYSYDGAGQLQSLTLPSSNVVSYTYANGQVASLTLNGSTTIISGVLYQPFGPTMGWTWGNATLAVREYDADGNITDLDSAGLKTYSYDHAFRVTGITDAADTSLSQGYSYDVLDRLTSATGVSLNQSWTYDANGNRLTQGGSTSSAYTVSTANNRLNAVSGALSRTYTYDAAGNVTADGSAAYTYDDAGRMVSVTKASVTTTYKLNALGQRVRKTTAGVNTYFVYDDAGHLVGEYDNSGALIQETIWFGDIPVGVLKPNGSGGVSLFYVHTDHLNTPRRISRPSDNVIVWRWDSDPFGTTAANQDPDGDSSVFAYNLRLPGQYFDSETGLHYNYYRDYDPSTGRYVQSDPIGLRGGLNTYGYTSNQPISAVDPYGLYQLTSVTENWSYSAEGVKLGKTRGMLGRSSCSCSGCGTAWKLDECSNALEIQVLIHPNLTESAEAFARRSEGQHVSDFYRGVPRIVKAGTEAERVLKQRTFSSKSECESECSDAVTKAVWAARSLIEQESADKYDRGPRPPHAHPFVPWPYK